MQKIFQIDEKKASEFLKKLKEIRVKTMAELSLDDYEHYKDFRKKVRLFKLIGYATAPFFPNIFSAIGLGVGRVGNWINAHHITHKGYDQVPGFPEKLKSKNFAKGAKRYIDWLDWMLPEAWAYEHNILHHTYTGEKMDPDIPECVFSDLTYQLSKMTNFKINFDSNYTKAFIFLSSIFTWRWSHYAPNTLGKMYEKNNIFKYKDEGGSVNRKIFLDKKLWLECYLPYYLYNFVLMPSLYLPLGPIAMGNAFINSCLGELIANIHSFMVIVTNHAGEDLYRYSNKSNSNMEKFFRQILGSVNFKTGGNWNDFFHMYLNYQIEHHIWPDLPMSAYQRVQPQVKKLCEEFNIPYVQENIFTRLWKTYENAIGVKNMEVADKIVTSEHSAAA